MQLRVLAIGDVTSDSAVDFLGKHLTALRKLKGIDLVICNGENASVTGILPQQAEALRYGGVDIITLGNHAWGERQINDYLDNHSDILRPDNIKHEASGVGHGIYQCKGCSVAIAVLMGGFQMGEAVHNPLKEADRFLSATQHCTFRLVEFHAEATSEKLAMGYYIDGRASALWGTHTHVPTADDQILPKGTGYITDLGMTGAVHSVLGIPPEQSIRHFLGEKTGYYRSATGPCKMQGCLFTLDSDTGLCIQTERIDIR